MPATPSPSESERLPAPSPKARAMIGAHLKREHGIAPFRLDDHVHLGGPRLASQHITWHPANATFHCDLCPGYVFSTGELTLELIRSAQLWDQSLKPSLVGLTPEERDEMTRLHLSGAVNRERLRQLRGADARRRAAHGKRPTVDHRRERLQPWLLARVAEVGVLERVLDEAEVMQRSDPDAWAALCDKPRSRETLRDYWQDIPAEKRRAAFAAGKKKST